MGLRVFRFAGRIWPSAGALAGTLSEALQCSSQHAVVSSVAYEPVRVSLCRNGTVGRLSTAPISSFFQA